MTWQRFYHRLSLNSPLPIWSHCAIRCLLAWHISRGYFTMMSKALISLSIIALNSNLLILVLHDFTKSKGEWITQIMWSPCGTVHQNYCLVQLFMGLRWICGVQGKLSDFSQTNDCIPLGISCWNFSPKSLCFRVMMRFISWMSSIRFPVHLLSNNGPLLQMSYLIVFMTCSKSRFLVFNAVCIFLIFLKVDVPCSSWPNGTITCLWSSLTPKCSSGHRSTLFYARGTSCIQFDSHDQSPIGLYTQG